ncbi:MAG: hypothetical protein SWH61_17685 [Thermodesulfobacteriota bacterium]|nr:hypothetical protein [Thermodesulfobacteriota bacterium]
MNRKILPYIIPAALPLILFYWMIPFCSDLTLGTDYVNYHIYHQLDLLFSIKSGTFPLYAPECFYGQSAAAYTQAQIYHPLPYIASILPGFWDGYSLEWMTALRMVLLFISHITLFRFVRRLKISNIPALIISTIIVYNMRTLALFWNGAALEAYTGFLFLCISIGMYCLSPTRLKGPAWIIFSTYWLLTSGYPPMVYYGMIGAVCFTSVIPFFLTTILNEKPVNLSRVFHFWGQTLLFLLIGIVLASAYLLPFFFDFLKTNAGRVDQAYQWSVEYNDTLSGFINNFFYPLKSAFGMFGGSPFYLMAIVTPVLLFFRYKIPKSILLILFIIVFITLYMQGDRTIIHPMAWKYLPIISNVRVPSYASIVLPFFMGLMLIWLVAANPVILEINKKHIELSPIVLTTIVALILTGIYFLLPSSLFNNVHFACPYKIRAIPGWVEPTIIITSCLILSLTLSLTRHKAPPLLAPFQFLLFVLVILQITIFFRWGAFAIEKKTETPTYNTIGDEKKKSINFQKVYYLNTGAGSQTVRTQLKNYFMEPQLARTYQKMIPARDAIETYKILNNTRKENEVVIEGAPPEEQNKIKIHPQTDTPDRVNLLFSSYNRMVFQVLAAQPTIFVFSYPNTGHWKALLNNNDCPIYRANGAAHGILIPSGKNTIEFRYWSGAAFWGMVVSCTTLALLGIITGIMIRQKGLKVFIAGGTLIAAIMVFLIWYMSLYTGDNLQTEFTWQTPPETDMQNLAFGKPTSMSSHRHGVPYRYNSRHAVDGDTTAASCFLTDNEQSPWWMVDLKGIHVVDSIIIYKNSIKGTFCNQMPIMASFSKNGREWDQHLIVQPEENDGGIIRIQLHGKQQMRYLKIQSLAECILSLNEVEIMERQKQHAQNN